MAQPGSDWLELLTDANVLITIRISTISKIETSYTSKSVHFAGIKFTNGDYVTANYSYDALKTKLGL